VAVLQTPVPRYLEGIQAGECQTALENKIQTRIAHPFPSNTLRASNDETYQLPTRYRSRFREGRHVPPRGPPPHQSYHPET
jgi:hypothetical protein